MIENVSVVCHDKNLYVVGILFVLGFLNQPDYENPGPY